jgi:hypothetical protein
MPKKTRLHKLQNQLRTMKPSLVTQPKIGEDDFLKGDPSFKKDMMKSIFFAVLISVFEIALYFIYYLRVFERR